MAAWSHPRSNRTEIVSLLRTRKLDTTLMASDAVSALDPARRPADLASMGVPTLDTTLGGGLRRGQVSEVIGERSSGRTGVMYQAMRAAAARDELVALIDTNDRFDPQSASAADVDLTRVLWVRDTGDLPRAIKAMNLVLQAGGFGLVVLDLVDVPAHATRALPFTTWFRLARVIEGSQTVALVIASEHLARSAGGSTIVLETPAGSSRAIWTGQSSRARLLHGIALTSRVVGGY
jgi:recombination protein RecA